ncbi:hypothetical protein LSCM4_02455 [Leishmania orientalis]|uniref:Uncharacterized protein n=1 Tax=Leishmania orientalis TaxID=2249476 RepID=A0A836GBJ0_9TRYP|nr:hypothetical protein LSCM4_02455 [Leishmania orientalis]
MQSAAGAWETMADSAARARLRRLRQSAASLQDVYSAFAPWQHLSTSVRGLDTLLSVAGVCGGASAGDDRSGTESCIGGLPVGGLHELYGPPLSGKSWILRRIGAAYVRRMTAYRQWYNEHLERVSAWDMEVMRSTHTDVDANATKDNEGLVSEGDVAAISTDSASASPVTAVEEWDLYVCLVNGAGAGSTTDHFTASPPSPSPFSPDVRSWMEELVAPFGTSPTLVRQEAGFTGSAHQHSSPHRRRQEQRAYAEQHIHFCVVHSPNELLAFLERLSGDVGSAPCTGAVFADSASSVVPPVPFTAAQRQIPPPKLSRGSLATSMRGQKRHRAPDTAVASSPSFPLPCGSFPGCTWRLQRQRLLLLDGLDALWLHPTLGNHSATHAGQWFAEELHRHLRALLSPRLCCSAANGAFTTASSNAAAGPPEPQHTLYSTVVFTNGCNGSNGCLLTAQKLEARLTEPVQGALGWMVTVPRPSGNAVWLRAADTRCLVEPAHPGLVSMPTPSSSYEWPAKVPCGPGATRQSVGRIAGTFGRPTENSLESLVTVVKGGSRVAATWVLRNFAGG